MKVVFFGVVIITTILALWSDKFSAGLGGWMDESPRVKLWGIWVALMVVQFSYQFSTGGIGPNWWRLVLYSGVPVALWTMFTNWGSPPSPLIQMLVGFAMWLPVDMRILGQRLVNGKRPTTDFAVIFLIEVILLLVMWKVLANSQGLKANYQVRGKDLAAMTGLLLITAAVVIPAGLLTGFIHPSRELVATSSWDIPAFVVSKVFTLTFLTGFLKIVAATALPEEILFRGVFQNILDSTFGEKFWTLAVGSLLFGAGHLNNGATSWWITGWNWKYFMFSAVVGGVYTYLYRKSTSLLVPITLHALVDLIWGTFFPH